MEPGGLAMIRTSSDAELDGTYCIVIRVDSDEFFNIPFCKVMTPDGESRYYTRSSLREVS